MGQVKNKLHSNTEREKLRFIEFLKENNALENYKEFFRSANPNLILDEWVTKEIKDGDAENLINYTGSWESSKKGFKYWESLHDKWYRLF